MNRADTRSPNPFGPADSAVSVVRVAACVVLMCLACSEPPTAPASPTEPAEPPQRAAPSPAAAIPVWRSIDPPAETGALGLSLTATAAGVVATWIEPRDGDTHRVRLSTLERDTWGRPSTVIAGDDLIANWADFPRASTSASGALFVHYLRRSGDAAYAYEIRLMRSDDRGRTFRPLGLLHDDGTPTEHGFVSMVPDGDGVRLFWLDGRATVDDGGATAVYTAAVGDAVGDAVRLDERACDCCQTDATRAAAGPLVVFRDRTADEQRDIAIARSSGGGFEPSATVHRDAWEIAGCPVNGPAVDADDRRVVVAWFTGADGGSVRVAFSDDGGARFGEPILIDPDQPPGRVDVAILDGGAAVSWLARARGRAEIRVRYVRDDGRLGAATRVAETATERASGFPVMARDADRILIAYRDGATPPRVHVSQLPVSDLPREPGATTSPSEPDLLAAGDTLPASASVIASDGPTPLHTLADGGPMLVAFFARWCQPCREELRALESVRAAAPDVTVVAVSLDEGSAARAEATARRWGFTGRVVRDHDAAATLGVPPIPGLFLMDQHGTLRGAWRGERLGADAILSQIRSLDD